MNFKSHFKPFFLTLIFPRNSLLCAFILGFFVTSAHAEPLSIEVFDSKANVSLDSFAKQIRINDRLINASTGDQISVTVSDSQSLSFTINSVKEGYGDAKIISADTSSGEHLLLTMDDKASFGTIDGNGVNYNISHDAELGQLLINQNDPDFPVINLGNDGLIPPGKSADKPGYLQGQRSIDLSDDAITAAMSSGTSVITVMVLYSRQFRDGFASPNARVNQLIEFSNQAYKRSGINIQLKLVRAQTYSFDNNASISALLSQITNGDGSFSGVDALRNQYKADLVALLPFLDNNGSAGVAWVNGDSQRFAYSVTRMSTRCCDSVFAHEIGHNLGSGHEHRSANPQQGSPCDFNFTGYSCGHGNASRGWGTIMSYLNSGRADYVFSNPRQQCLGEPCGIPEGRSSPADNARSFNISGPLVANFRQGNDGVPNTPSTPPRPRNTDPTMAPVLDLLLEEK